MLELQNITKHYGAVAALHDVSIAFRPGEVHAICGENGAGKSTLVKVLAGLVHPDAGVVLWRGRPIAIKNATAAQRLGVALVAQELSICPDLSVLDNIWLGSAETPFLHRRSALRKRARALLGILGLADFDLDAAAGSLSLGQRQMLEIARAMARDAHTLILDEPTATLSDAEIRRVFEAVEALRSKGKSIVFISHRLAEIFSLCATTTILRGGRVAASAPTASFDRETLIHHMLGRASSEMFPEALARAPGAPGLSVRGLQIPGIVEDFSAVAEKGSILCVAGQLGSGAVEVVRALAGLVPEASGKVSLADGRPAPLGSVEGALAEGIMLISGDRAAEGIFLDLTVQSNLTATTLSQHARWGWLSFARLRAYAREFGAKARVDLTRSQERARRLSGGNQQKLAFGRLLGQRNLSVLVMYEPTRGIDLGARAEIYQLMRELCARGCTLVLTSSDVEEIVGLSDVIMTLYRGRVVGRYRRGEADSARVVADITHPARAA